MTDLIQASLTDSLEALREAAEEGARNYVRPDWRQVNIALLAGKLYAAYMHSDFHNVELQLDKNPQHIVEAWQRVAEAAVDELIDKPDREFQAQLEAVLNKPEVESKAAREWREASADDWLPEHG